MALVLHQSGVSHGSSHRPHQHPQRGRCNHGNASVRAAFIHVVGDLVQSLGVLLAAAIIHFWVGVRGTFMFTKGDGARLQIRFTERILYLFNPPA